VSGPNAEGLPDARAHLVAATRARKRVERQAIQVEQEWRAAVRQAFVAGIPRDEIAALAEVSRSRAFQIRKGTR
jgi:hypothetical protein